MFAPTVRAVLLLALGVPVSVGLGLLAPGLWVMGGVWVAGVLGLLLIDLLLAARPSAAEVDVDVPAAVGVGATSEVKLSLGPGKGVRRNAEAALTAEPPLLVEGGPTTDVVGGSARWALTAPRRGEGEVRRLWLRWTGPLGLLWLTRRVELDDTVAVTPDINGVRDEAVRLFQRDASFGLKVQRRRGEGTEFDALVEWQPGIDRRKIDWKHSARHRDLHAKEYRTERNHNIVFAVDSGYLMSEPVPDRDGNRLSKLDRAVHAALLLGFVSLKRGDRVGWFAFDSAPYLFTQPVAGVNAFRHLAALSSRIRYGEADTNYTYGLHTLSQRLNRRSLVVVFTDFVDTVGAEAMVATVGRLQKTHLVVFVAFRDPEVDRLVTAEPETADDIARAVVAETLNMERDLVLAKLARLGVEVLDADADTLNTELLSRYLSIMRKELV